MSDNLILPSWLSRGIEEYFPIKGTDQTFSEIIDHAKKNNKKLRVKLGIDPTGTDIHLGHSILFKKLRAFQDNGHIAVLIIGDFTAQIGDPTGKSKTRVQLSEKQVKDNAKTYLTQLGMGKPANESILDFDSKDRIEIRYNSEWLKGLNLNSIIELMGSATVSQMLAKEEFNKRYTSQVPIALHEFLYPLLQGYDSVVVQSDIELGGTDQKFNIAIGRDLQRHFKQEPQFGVLLPILTGLDGIKKMSKSEFNTVGLTDDPLSMYSKLEKVPDDVIPSYFEQNQAEALELEKTVIETISQSVPDWTQTEIRSLLGSFGLTNDSVFKEVSQISGGEKARLALALMIIKPSNLLILDEPTNHLDVDSVAWLENYLSTWEGSILFVSHDRDFIDCIANRVIELDGRSSTEYVGDFSDFIIKREARLAQIEADAAHQSRKLNETERFIERFRYKASKAKQVQSRIKALERTDVIEVPQVATLRAKFEFPQPRRSARVVAEFDEASAGAII